MGERVIVSNLEGATTDVRGRFLITGPSYQLVSDGSVGSGGQGQAIGSLDLLAASLLSCALNTLRGAGSPDDELIPGRHVRIYARVERDLDDDGLGRIILEAFIDDASDAEVAALIVDFKQGCKVYRALKHSLDIVFIAHGAQDVHPSRIDIR